LTLVRLASTFTVSALSYYLVEAPIRRRRFANPWTPRLVLPAAVLATAAVIVVATS
jgi:peptidoglycan/LPS O-acetylase OafA/YrhL